jgi:hypothetical protein
MMVFDLILSFSFDGFFVYVSGVFEEINPRKQKLVQYALDVDKVEFNLLQDPEFHTFHCVKVGVSFEFFFFFLVLLKACVVRNIYLFFSMLT